MTAVKVSPFEDPRVLAEAAAIWRRALARRAERLAREGRVNLDR